jgi:hypothetical protein
MMTNERLKARRVSLGSENAGEDSGVTIERTPASNEEPETTEIELNRGDEVEIIGPDGFVLGYSIPGPSGSEEENDG